jgi:hypothetical protein
MWSTQKAMGQVAVRSQMNLRICFRVRERRDVDLILGQGMLNAGWHAHTLNAPGKFLISAQEAAPVRRNDPGDCCMKSLPRLGAFGWIPNGLQGAEVVGDCQGVVRVGDQADVSVWAYEDRGVLAVCVCRVPGVVDDAAWPDQVGLDDVCFEVVKCGAAAFTQAEQGEMGSAEEVEQAFLRAGERVAAGGVWCPVSRPWSAGSARGVAGQPTPPVSELELGEFGPGRTGEVHSGQPSGAVITWTFPPWLSCLPGHHKPAPGVGPGVRHRPVSISVPSMLTWS